MLVAGDITVRFGGLVALEEVSLEVPAGCIAGLIGPNGAGKTTMFNVLTGLQEPTGGRVDYLGQDISRWPPHRRGRAGMARTFQRLALFSRLTVHDNLVASWESSHGGGVLGRGRAERIARVARGDGPARPVAGGRPAWPASSRPDKGRMVELGRALCTDPRVLLLDEPGSGLDAGETAVFSTRCSGPSSWGGAIPVRPTAPPAILLVEHDMALVMDVSAAITVLDFGKVMARGTPDQVGPTLPTRAGRSLGDASGF